MNDYIKVDYLIEAFPKGEVFYETVTKGENPEVEIVVADNEMQYRHIFKRKFLVNALSDEGLQKLIIDIFKKRLK